jgi:hypothetical protein
MPFRPMLPAAALVLAFAAAPARAADASSAAQATPPSHQWFTVLLDGRKIGRFETDRDAREGRVVTTQSLDLVLERAGSSVALRSRETSTETPDGRPLGFASVSRLSGEDTTVEGKVQGEVAQVITRTGGIESRRVLAWPAGALLLEGTRLAGMRAGLAPGTRWSALAFQPSSLDAVEVTSVVQPSEMVELPGGRMRLVPVEQTARLAGSAMRSRVWVDAAQTVYKLTMPLFGVDLTLLACDQACATAPNQGSDVFARTLVQSPRPITPLELQGTLRYVLDARDAGTPLSLPQTDEQTVVREGNRLVVEVRRAARPGREDAPAPADFRPNDWLQSRSPEVVRLALQAVGDARDPRERMRRIQAFVRGYIRSKNLDVGYASALEVARRPEGDCTEHAVLLAAMGRAVGIATRVVDGLAFAPGFAGQDRVFVPHAWAQAFVDGRWEGFDAALPGFDAGHIALSVGDGDPWRFYSGLDLLGRVALEDVRAVP